MAAVLASSSPAQVPSGPPASPETAQRAPRQHGPMQLLGRGPKNTVTSGNWSGYAVTGTSFTQALGSWIVPAVDCSVTPSTYSSFWVGIDGYSDSTVEQTGTDSDCSGGTPTYYAWYEFYPQPSFYACERGRNQPACALKNLTPGDVMQASVTFTPGRLAAFAPNLGTYTVTITDVTTGATFTTTALGNDQRSSVEWIAEAPSLSTGVVPLADFGTVSFGVDSTSVANTNYATEGAGNSMPISSFGSSVQEIVMASGGTNEAVPSALSTDGTSFTVTWSSE
jgi:hypothetical protein